MQQKIIPLAVDRTAKKSDYSHLGPEELLVHSTFLTLQGEGPYTGRKAFFIRLGGCNYGGKSVAGSGCRFCDTSFHIDQSKPRSFLDLAYEFRQNFPRHAVGYNRLLVITGGEPLLQKNLPKFCDYIGEDGDFCDAIQIETNGSIPLPEGPDLNYVYFVVSPKVPEVEGARSEYSKLPKATLQRADCLKVLVSADPESPYHEIPSFVWEYIEMHKENRCVFLSPINVYKSQAVPGRDNLLDPDIYDHAAIAENHNYAARLCIEHNFILSTQAHLLCSLQ